MVIQRRRRKSHGSMGEHRDRIDIHNPNGAKQRTSMRLPLLSAQNAPSSKIMMCDFELVREGHRFVEAMCREFRLTPPTRRHS